MTNELTFEKVTFVWLLRSLHLPAVEYKEPTVNEKLAKLQILHERGNLNDRELQAARQRLVSGQVWYTCMYVYLYMCKYIHWMRVSWRRRGIGFCQGRCGRVCFDGQMYVMYLYVYMYMCICMCMCMCMCMCIHWMIESCRRVGSVFCQGRWSRVCVVGHMCIIFVYHMHGKGCTHSFSVITYVICVYPFHEIHSMKWIDTHAMNE